MTDTIFDDVAMSKRERLERRRRTVQKAIVFVSWLVPLFILVVAVFIYASSDAVEAVFGIALACIWLGININTYFKEGD